MVTKGNKYFNHLPNLVNSTRFNFGSNKYERYERPGLMRAVVRRSRCDAMNRNGCAVRS